jgi:phytoene/squalene synthetase
MRLQFWRDVVRDEGEPAHEVAGPLASLIATRGLDRALLHRMIDAREAEIGSSAPFADEASLWRYLEDGAGALLAVSVQALGGSVSPDTIALGSAQGLANYMMAVPALAAAGQKALPSEAADAIAGLARAGLSRRSRALPGLRRIPRAARPALLAAWRAEPILTSVSKRPTSVLDGTLGQSEFARRGGLLWRSLSGRV